MAEGASLKTSREGDIYRDVEKLYRVLGYYEGQDIKPLDDHERHIDLSLDENLRDPTEYIRRVQYEIQMSEVICARAVVYRPEKPELTLLYTLFAEGIESIILLRDLAALDIREWCELVRRTIIAFDENLSNKDLASILWRSPARNIRTRIYNALLDLEEMARQVEKQKKRDQPQDLSATSENSEPMEGEENEAKDFHHRDHEWDVPDGDQVARKVETPEKIASDGFENATSMIETVALNPELPQEFLLKREEIRVLADEFSFFDQDHVDYNLLSWNLAFLRGVDDPDSQARAYAEGELKRLVQGIVGRLQPGLIALLLELMKTLDHDRFRELKEQFHSTVTETLKQPGNEKRLLTSLKDPERVLVTKRLLAFLDPKQFPSIVDFYLSCGDHEGLVAFLKTVIERDLTHENLFFSWGEDRLVEVLPYFRRLEWPLKYEFLKRAIRSNSAKIQKQASYYLINVPLEVELALKTYASLTDETKEIWLQSLIEHPPKDGWRAFVHQALQSDLWLNTKSSTLREKLLSSWILLSVHYTQGRAWTYFEKFLTAKKFFFWPVHPEIRALCFPLLIQQRAIRENPDFISVCAREAKVYFQDESLRHQLRLLGRKA